MTMPSAFSFFSVSSYWLQIHNLEDCPSKENFFFRDLVTSQISYVEIKDEPSSYQAGVLIVISSFFASRDWFTSRSSFTLIDKCFKTWVNQKKKNSNCKTQQRTKETKILRTDSDESRFDQIALMDTLTEENEKRKMASSSSTWERRFSMEFAPGLKGFERKFKCPYL